MIHGPEIFSKLNFGIGVRLIQVETRGSIEHVCVPVILSWHHRIEESARSSFFYNTTDCSSEAEEKDSSLSAWRIKWAS